MTYAPRIQKFPGTLKSNMSRENFYIYLKLKKNRIAVVIIHSLDRIAKISPRGSNPDHTEPIYDNRYNGSYSLVNDL